LCQPTAAAEFPTLSLHDALPISAATPQLVWTPTTPLVYGTTLAGALTAATSPVVAGGVSYAEGATAVTAATVLSVGAHTVTATLARKSTRQYTSQAVTSSAAVWS